MFRANVSGFFICKLTWLPVNRQGKISGASEAGQQNYILIANSIALMHAARPQTRNHEENVPPSERWDDGLAPREIPKSK